MQHDLVGIARGVTFPGKEILRRRPGREPPAAIDVARQLVIAQLQLAVLGIRLDGIDQQGGHLAHVGHAIRRIAREHQKELAAARELVAPGVDAVGEVVQGMVPKGVHPSAGIHAPSAPA